MLSVKLLDGSIPVLLFDVHVVRYTHFFPHFCFFYREKTFPLQNETEFESGCLKLRMKVFN